MDAIRGQPVPALSSAAPIDKHMPSRRRRLWRRNARGVVGGFVAVLLCAIGVAAPWLAPYDPLEQTIVARLRPPVWQTSGTDEYLLGTDGLGRDLLSRMIYGARISLVVSISATLLAGLIGIGLGLLAGYFGRGFDQVIMGLVDVQLAFPFILLAMTFMTVFRPSVSSVIIVLALSGWAGFCRMVRGQVLVMRQREYVEAARALGASDFWILVRHVLPNILPVILVLITINVGRFVLAEASLSYVGLGVSPPTPSWGAIINEGRDYIFLAWWIQTLPGLAIVLTVLGIGLLGDWLRDRVDPRLRV
jgi:ABC-type dipeptide/oligopeptide/nickel transport system permease subunit